MFDESGTYSIGMGSLVDGKSKILDLVGIFFAHDLSRLIRGYLSRTQC